MRLIAFALAILVTLPASAHPNGPRYWSLRTLIRTSDSSAEIVVGLEIPLRTVLRGMTESADGGKVEARHQQAFTQMQWNTMAAGLVLKADGTKVDVEFRPVAHPMNGKAGPE
jgi:hypothetical protein